MAFQLAPCTNTDMDRAFAIISDSFGHEHPYIEYVFPDHDTPVGRKVGAERIRAIKNSDLSTTYLKVTNTDTGVIVAVAKWNIYDGVIPEEVQLDGDYWETETKKELAREIFAGYLRPRQEAIREAGGRLVCKCVRIIEGDIRFTFTPYQTALDMLCVDPAYQRQGAGRMLVRWGTQVADRMGVKVSRRSYFLSIVLTRVRPLSNLPHKDTDSMNRKDFRWRSSVTRFSCLRTSQVRPLRPLLGWFDPQRLHLRCRRRSDAKQMSQTR